MKQLGLEKKFEEIIVNYLQDDCTWVHTLDINPMKQVIEIDKETGDINHYEDRQYYHGFENIFREYFADSFFDAIDIYDYFIYKDYHFLARWLLENCEKYVNAFGDLDEVNYVKYVAQWWKEHGEGNPVCFREWQKNECLLDS